MKTAILTTIALLRMVTEAKATDCFIPFSCRTVTGVNYHTATPADPVNFIEVSCLNRKGEAELFRTWRVTSWGPVGKSEGHMSVTFKRVWKLTELKCD